MHVVAKWPMSERRVDPESRTESSKIYTSRHGRTPGVEVRSVDRATALHLPYASRALRNQSEDHGLHALCATDSTPEPDL